MRQNRVYKKNQLIPRVYMYLYENEQYILYLCKKWDIFGYINNIRLK